MMVMKKILTNKFTKGDRGKNDISFIVVHYTASEGSAEANANYFKNSDREASAHFVVGHKGEIIMCVDPKNTAWHCGGGKQSAKGGTYFNICKNSNSIGIEMCCLQTNGTWEFKDATVASTKKLVKKLMKTYGVSPDHVIRHYDVVGKICPEPYVRGGQAWADFKKDIS